jgi:leucine-rich repeat protein SHOC2
MEQEKLEQKIEQARLNISPELELRVYKPNTLPESIGNLVNLKHLKLQDNKLEKIPDSLGNLSSLNKLELQDNNLNTLPESFGNLANLIVLNLYNNQMKTLPISIGNLSMLSILELGSNRLTTLPNSIGSLHKLTKLNLWRNQLKNLPESISNLSELTSLNLGDNQLINLPDNIGNLSKLTHLGLGGNQLKILPESIGNLSNLECLDLEGNPLTDLSVLKNLPRQARIRFLGVYFSHRYWTKLDEWKSEWLLDETNAEIRNRLIEQIGYEKIIEDLDIVILDTWREYYLLKIENVETIYVNEDGDPIVTKPMVLLKMTCPSTQHIHILRVPPEMTSAEAAITWVNHGIHPDEFAVQT